MFKPLEALPVSKPPRGGRETGECVSIGDAFHA